MYYVYSARLSRPLNLWLACLFAGSFCLRMLDQRLTLSEGAAHEQSKVCRFQESSRSLSLSLFPSVSLLFLSFSICLSLSLSLCLCLSLSLSIYVCVYLTKQFMEMCILLGIKPSMLHYLHRDLTLQFLYCRAVHEQQHFHGLRPGQRGSGSPF